MARRIGNPTRLTGKRKLTRVARAAMAAAARANAKVWNERQQKDANERREAIERFETQLRAELGDSITAERETLVQAIVVAHGGLLLVKSELMQGRKKRALALSERASWLAGTVARLLKQLGMRSTPRPRTLADLVARSNSQTVQNSAANV
jgi:hypothetical protein